MSKKLKQIFSMLLAMTMVTGLLGGCAGSSGSVDTITDIKDTGRRMPQLHRLMSPTLKRSPIRSV